MGEPAARPPLTGGLVGYRLLRRIASGERADVYLAVADLHESSGQQDAAAFAPPASEAVISDGDTAPPLVVVRVYAAEASSESVALEIEAMSTDAGGTLPALYDVAGLDDGRCCLTVERISGVAVSRLLTERTLRAGEAVTILAPIAVAVADLAAGGFVHTRLAAADILLDDAGRPRLIGLGALRRLPGDERAAEHTASLRTAHVALTELLEDVAAAVRPAGAFDDAIDLMRGRLETRPFRRCEADLERALFAAAAPEPITGVEVRVRSARLPARIGGPAAPDPHPVDESEPARRVTTRHGGGIRGLVGLAQLPDDLGARLAGAADLVPGARVRARVGSAIRSRRRALTVGSLIGGGALVLMLTLVPPATATDSVESDASATSAGVAPPPDEAGADPSARPADAAPTANAEEGTTASETVGDDPAAAARVLLERRAECFETLDLGCLDGVLQPGSAIESDDRAALLAARDGAELVDSGFDLTAVHVTAEMGDAVLIGLTRATPEREPASLLVVRGEAGWRLREIFD